MSKNLIKVIAKAQVIKSLKQLVSVLSVAKCGGQFVTYTIVKPVTMNVFPTDGSERERRDPNFVANYEQRFQINYGTDYDKQMAKKLGLDSYEAHDSNSEHIVPNVLKVLKSTGNVCFISIEPKEIEKHYIGADGQLLSESELAYMRRYKAKPSVGVLPYFTISAKYIKRIALNNAEYIVDIADCKVNESGLNELRVAV